MRDDLLDECDTPELLLSVTSVESADSASYT